MFNDVVLIDDRLWRVLYCVVVLCCVCWHCVDYLHCGVCSRGRRHCKPGHHCRCVATAWSSWSGSLHSRFRLVAPLTVRNTAMTKGLGLSNISVPNQYCDTCDISINIVIFKNFLRDEWSSIWCHLICLCSVSLAEIYNAHRSAFTCSWFPISSIFPAFSK